MNFFQNIESKLRFSVIIAVLVSNSNGQSRYSCLLTKAKGIFLLGIGHTMIHTAAFSLSHQSKLRFHIRVIAFRHFDYFLCVSDIFLNRKERTVIHDGGKSHLKSLLNGFKGQTMIQMYRNIYRRILRRRKHHGSHQFQGSRSESRLRQLQNHRNLQFLNSRHHAHQTFHAINAQGGTGSVLFSCIFQQLTHLYQWHFTFPLNYLRLPH